MTKLRSIAVVAVLGAALFASQAQAQEQAAAAGGGWNTKYGMIFTVQNVFGNNDKSTLDDINGSVGLQYNLSPQSALRLMVNLSRDSDSAYVSEDTHVAANGVATTVKTFHAPAFTSQYGVGLGVDYMMRLTADALAPYLGVGAGIGYGQRALAYKDDVNPLDVTEVDNMTRTMGLGAEGILGVEWRVHKSISIFAEYALGLGLVSYTSTNNESTNTQPAPVGTTSDKSTSSHTEYFNWQTGLGQQGMIGLVAFF